MKSIFQFTDYRDILKNAVAERSKRNGSLSLRAFARDCDVSPSYLSRILKGDRLPNVQFVSRACRRLELTSEETAYFLNLVAAQHSKPMDRESMTQQVLAARPKRGRKILEEDKFLMVADWHYFAILTLTQTRSFRGEPDWIAKRLNLPLQLVINSLQRLVRVGFLKKVGRKYKMSEDVPQESLADVPSKAAMLGNKQHIRLSEKYLDLLHHDQREFQAATIPMNLADLAKAKKQVRIFMDKFIADFEKDPGDEVVQINLQFYLMSRPVN